MEEGLEYNVVVRKKTVDSTYMDVQVPSIAKPNFEVAEGINLVPINGLVDVCLPWKKYVVIGIVLLFTGPLLEISKNEFKYLW